MSYVPQDYEIPDGFRSLTDFDAARTSIYDSVFNAAQARFPVEGRGVRLELADLRYTGPERYTKKEEKEALLRRKTLYRPLKGTFNLVDSVSGQVLDTRNGLVARVPYMTPRGTFIRNGVEYTVANQPRLLSGVFSREKENGEYETMFNILGGGPSFRLFMDPDTGVYKMQVGKSKIPLVPLLRELGVTEAQMKERWGPKLLAANLSKAGNEEVAVRKAYERLARSAARLNTDGKRPPLKEILDSFKLDTRVTGRTLGKPYDRITPEAILDATQKLFAISRGEADPDDRDSLAFQETYSPEDLFSERIAKDAGGVLRRAVYKAQATKSLSNLQAGVLDRLVDQVFTRSGLASCFDADTYVLTKRGFIKWPDVRDEDLFACKVDGRVEWHRALRVVREHYSGPMYGVSHRRLSYLVTPSHRCYVGVPRKKAPPSWRFEAAEDVHEKHRKFLTALGVSGAGVDPGEFVFSSVDNRWGKSLSETIGSLDWCRFLGWWLAEGSAFTWSSRKSAGKSISYDVTVAQTRASKHYSDLEELVARLPWKMRYSAPGRAFVCRNKPVYEELSRCGVKESKRIPRYVFDLPDTHLRALFECYMAGDGNEHGGYSKAETISYGLALDLVELWGRLGGTGRISCTRKHVKNKNWKPTYVVSFSKGTVGRARSYKSRNLSSYFLSRYDGQVYCAEVPGGLLYVLRDGKPHWSGNSLEEINPIDAADQNLRLTRLGEGGIESRDSIPLESRNVQPSQFMFVDPIRAPESGSVGVDSRAVFGTLKGPDKRLYTFARDRNGKPALLSPEQTTQATIAFPGELARAAKEGRRKVAAMSNGRLQYVDTDEVQYEAPSSSQLYTLGSNLVLGAGKNIKGGRLLMGCLSPSTLLFIRRAGGSVFFGEVSRYVWQEGDMAVSCSASGSLAWKRVLGVKENTDSSFCLRIRLKSGRELVTTENHKWVTIGPDGRLVEILASDLRVGTAVPRAGRIPAYPATHREFVTDAPNKHNAHPQAVIPATAEFGWVVGLYAAEGSMSGGNNGMGDICFAAKVPEIQLRVASFLSTYGVPFRAEDSSLHVSWTGLAGLLDRLVGRDSYRKCLDGSLLGAPEEFRRGLLSGYLAGDGATGLRRGFVRVTGGSRSWRLVDGLVMIASTLGIDLVRSEISVEGRPFYKFEVRAQDISKLGVIHHPEKDARLRDFPSWTGKKSYSWVPIYDELRAKVLGVSARKERFRQRSYVDQHTKESLSERLSVEDCSWIGSDVVWDRVASIEDAGSEDLTYDLDLGDATVMCGDGVLVHNSKFFLQALPLDKREAPLVSPILGDGRNAYDLAGTFAGAVRAKDAGVVTEVRGDEVDVTYADGRRETIELYDNFPLNRKTLLSSSAAVQPGQQFKKGEVLATSNYTDAAGRMASGINLRTAYLPYDNYEDSILVSESAAKKLSSQHMYSKKMDFTDFAEPSRAKFLSLFPKEFSKEQLKMVDDAGVVKAGQIVKKGDPLVLAVERRVSKGSGMLRRGGRGSFTDASLRWDHDFDAEVVDVYSDDEGVKLTVKASVPAKPGDKLSGAYGDKGVISRIVPDEDMPATSEGPVDVLLNPLGVISRGNPAQMYEAVLGKIARKTGKPYELNMDEIDDVADFVEREMRKHDVSDTEDLYDPLLRRKIKDVFVGERYLMKLHHLAESKAGARGIGSYTVDGEPAASSEGNPKRLGWGELVALVSHGATNAIKDTRLIRSNRNDDYWRAMMQGQTPNMPNVPNTYRKFISYLAGAGIGVTKKGDSYHLQPLTDRAVESISNGEIDNKSTVRWLAEFGRGTWGEKSMDPVKGGLFDRGVTGGHGGIFFSHISLPEPIPQPVMAPVTRTLLGLTEKKFEAVLDGDEEIPGFGTGAQAIKKKLASIKPHLEIPALAKSVKTSRGGKRDEAVKKLKYLQSMQAMGVSPEELMISKLPVIPPVFRPITTTDKFTMVAGVNRLYENVLELKDLYAKTAKALGADSSQARKVHADLYRAARAVTGLGDPVRPDLVQQGVKGIIKDIVGSSSKFGLFQRRLLGSSVDLAGRGAIRPGYDLDMDHIGLPEDLAWKLYGRFVVNRLVQKGGVRKRADAVRDVADRTPRAKEMLLDEMKDRPVMATRAPALHRYSLMAHKPVLVKGDAIQIPPSVVVGFSADFDGDAMNVHAIPTQKGIDEALEKLLPSKNLKSPADFDVHMLPRQEYLEGLWRASTAKKRGQPKVFESTAAVRKALLAGELDLGDRVVVMDKKRAIS